MARDPYLKPGVPCYLNVDGMFTLFVFTGKYENNGNPLFWHPGRHVSTIDYRPIGTEWDYALKEHICSTVSHDGRMMLWAFNRDLLYPNTKLGAWFERIPSDNIYHIFCGICPDKSRYEGDNWQDSFRPRPFWAGGEG